MLQGGGSTWPGHFPSGVTRTAPWYDCPAAEAAPASAQLAPPEFGAYHDCRLGSSINAQRGTSGSAIATGTLEAIWLVHGTQMSESRAAAQLANRERR